MRLLVAFDDYCFQKVKILFSLIGRSVPVQFAPEAELTALDASSRGMVLENSDGVVTQHNAILRYIAIELGAAWLLGDSDIEKAQNEQWLEYCWREIECPFHAHSLTNEQAVKTKACADIVAAVRALDSHLSAKTFFVGEGVSLSDISVFATWLQILDSHMLRSGVNVHFDRWARSLANHAKVRAAVPARVLDLVATQQPSGKWDRHRIRVKELLDRSDELLGQRVTVKGWVRTSRSADKGALLFVELSDGSFAKGVQLVLDMANTIGAKEVSEAGGVGSCIAVEGTVVASPARGQTIEIHVTHAKVLGAVYGGENGEIGAKNYPMAKKQHTLEFLREKAHLRPRSKVFSAAMRIRHAMAFATHKFFNDLGFVYVHTPLITAADCEGAGEQFVVTTLLPEHAKVGQIPVAKDSTIDYSKDFFGRRCCLTVSGQLNVETHACALSDVYTFGPTFRAENSHTARHLAEFWMIEPEICFADLFDNMALAEDYVKFCTSYALEHCAGDLHYFEHEYPAGEKGLQDRLRNVVENDFARITYTEAIELLHKEVAEGRAKFAVYPHWGDDLGSEHERYITEKVFQKPTIVINYPKGIKAFYMKLNDDKETVAAMDILVPKIGELIGGSQREDDLATLERRCSEMGMSPKDIWWYADLRRYGTVPHAGFGLGFERLVMFVTGLENIRDVIPFPRVPGHAEF